MAACGWKSEHLGNEDRKNSSTRLAARAGPVAIFRISVRGLGSATGYAVQKGFLGIYCDREATRPFDVAAGDARIQEQPVIKPGQPGYRSLGQPVPNEAFEEYGPTRCGGVSPVMASPVDALDCHVGHCSFASLTGEQLILPP